MRCKNGDGNRIGGGKGERKLQANVLNYLMQTVFFGRPVSQLRSHTQNTLSLFCLLSQSSATVSAKAQVVKKRHPMPSEFQLSLYTVKNLFLLTRRHKVPK